MRTALQACTRGIDRIVVTSDVSGFANVLSEAQADLVLLYNDAMPAHRIAGALDAPVEAYGDREASPGREVPNDWA